MEQNLPQEQIKVFLEELFNQSQKSIIKEFLRSYRQLRIQEPELAISIEKDLGSVLESILQQLDDSWEQFEHYAINNVFFAAPQIQKTQDSDDIEMTIEETSQANNDVTMQELDNQLEELSRKIDEERSIQQQKLQLSRDLNEEINQYGDLSELDQIKFQQVDIQQQQEEIQRSSMTIQNMLDEVQELLNMEQISTPQTDDCRKQAYRELRDKIYLDLDQEKITLLEEVESILG